MSASFLEVSKASSGDDVDEKFLVALDHITSIKPAECGSVITLANGVSLAVGESYDQLKAIIDVMIWRAPQSRPRAVA